MTEDPTVPPGVDPSVPSPARLYDYFEHLELIPPYPGAWPGLCCVGEWGADEPALADSEGSRALYCGVRRKP